MKHVEWVCDGCGLVTTNEDSLIEIHDSAITDELYHACSPACLETISLELVEDYYQNDG